GSLCGSGTTSGFGLSEQAENRLRVRIRLRQDRGADLHQDLELRELGRRLADVQVANRGFRGLQVDARDAVVVRIFVEANDDGAKLRLLAQNRLQRVVALADCIFRGEHARSRVRHLDVGDAQGLRVGRLDADLHRVAFTGTGL